MRERIEPVGIPSVHGGEDVKETIPVGVFVFRILAALLLAGLAIATFFMLFARR